MVHVLKDIFQSLYPYGVFRTGKAVYLTFDDGPIPEVTPKVLAILAHYGVKATFFMVGENIAKYPDVYQQVIRAGHAIGNHTYNHLKGWATPFDEYMENVAKCEQMMADHPTSLFRPPYGKATLKQRRALAKRGYYIIYWDILTQDYDAAMSSERMYKRIQNQVREGSIINFHDSLKSNERMLEVLPQTIEYLLAKGYEIKTL